MLSRPRGVLGWRHPPTATVGSDFVVVLSPSGDSRSGLGERLEPVLVQTFIPKLPVKALDVAVLHGTPRLDQHVANSVCLRPGHEHPAGEFWAVVGTHHARIPPKGRGLIEDPCHRLTRDAKVGGDVDAFMADIVSDGQAFEAPAIGQTVANEIHAPHLIDGLGQLQRHTLAGRPLGFLPLLYRQLGLAVEPVDPFVIHFRVCRSQQVVDPAVAEPASRLGDVDDGSFERHVLLVRRRRVSIAVSGKPHKSAGVAFREVEFFHHLADRFAFDLWG
jgi:hypothetical protein